MDLDGEANFDADWSQMKFAIFYQFKTPLCLFKYLKRMICGKSSKECPICYVKFIQGIIMVITPCKHFFHEDCLQK